MTPVDLRNGDGTDDFVLSCSLATLARLGEQPGANITAAVCPVGDRQIHHEEALRLVSAGFIAAAPDDGEGVYRMTMDGIAAARRVRALL